MENSYEHMESRHDRHFLVQVRSVQNALRQGYPRVLRSSTQRPTNLTTHRRNSRHRPGANDGTW